MMTYYEEIAQVEAEVQSKIHDLKVAIKLCEQTQKERQYGAQYFSGSPNLDLVAEKCALHLKTIARQNGLIKDLYQNAEQLIASGKILAAFKEYCKNKNPNLEIEVGIEFNPSSMQFIMHFNIVRKDESRVVFLPRLKLPHGMTKNNIKFKDLLNED